jgi:hypothetical protein
MNFEKGIRAPGEQDFSFIYEGTSFECDANGVFFRKNVNHPPFLESFEAINGYKPFDVITAKYKTAVVHKNRVYIGNIKQKKSIRDYANSAEESYPDRMIKSPVGKFDTFPQSNFIDVEISDGESITHLDTYADRILQFKERSMYVINVSGDFEFLEGTHKHKGVAQASNVTKTDLGLAWVNKNGLFFYDGQSVRNLLETKGQRIISRDSWESFFSTDACVGYDPGSRKIIVLKSATASSTNGNVFIYHMLTQSAMFGYKRFPNNKNYTNFWVNQNNELMIAHSANQLAADLTVVKWTDTATATDSTSDSTLTTKVIDFGSPSQNKKIYSIKISYKGSGTLPKVGYYADNATGASNRVPLNSDARLSASTTYTNVTLDLSTKLKSIQLEFYPDSSAIDSSFEINDMTIIYRMRAVR